MSKKSGSYYTPEILANFMAEYMQRRYASCNAEVLKILEPSCGDGIFLKAISTHFSNFDVTVDAVDLDASAIKKAANLVKDFDGKYVVSNMDYLDWCSIKEDYYDLIIGNPPYISKKYLSAEQKEKCRNIHARGCDFGNEIHNIWTAFLCDGISRLNDNGNMAFVLPAEILKVKFGEKIQKSLLENFNRIEVFTFSNNVFPNIEQDTIILFLFKSDSDKGLYFTTIDSSECLLDNNFRLERKYSLEAMKVKWSAYPLSEKHIRSIDKINSSIKPIISYCETVPGIVTAANDYFIVDQTTINDFELETISHPIIKKGVFVNGSIKLSKENMLSLIDDGKPAFFLDLSKIDHNNKKHNEYINIGIKRNIDQRYKCTLRDKWYEVPGAWISEGFFFKRCHDYPKLVYNAAETLVTDAAYRVIMKEGYDICSLIFSFYNSVTLAFSEIHGRYYGGGVLELTPSEFKSLPIPYIKINADEFNEFVELFKQKTSIEDVLNFSDNILLARNPLIEQEDIEALREVRAILMDRRLKICKSQFS
ncbi:Eco57I restriction-modification methylase domain-containing protein [Aeromonas salmonicida]|uniref:Eco57I restriction-modification methylase domain-containing protein n=1 Tax=Aeromonas salmonicida TaxID=645 RepID=UPI0012D9CE7C|nr:N-6 DNA methylase [Aeromonas salmonicida]MUG27681.1 N-6 DNA methylase [Aeromonas salmonicida]